MKKVQRKLSKLIAGFSAVIMAFGCGAESCMAAGLSDAGEPAVDTVAGKKVAINAANFPDPTFRAIISGPDYDKDGSGYFDADEITEIRNVDCEGMGVKSLKGVEFFTECRGLWCKDNNISKLDVSALKELQGLWCSGNPLTSLDITHNPELLWVYCFDCKLTSLDLSHNPKMAFVEINTNPLTGLDVTRNPELEHLTCGTCGLKTLDLSNNPKLAHLDAFSNKLKTLDVSRCPKLKRLDVWDNEGLKSIDVSHNPGLQYYNCSSNNAVSVDVTHNPELQKLSCAYNNIKKLDLSNNPKLVYLDCADNQITSLDLSHNPKLYFLQAFINNFTALDIGCNPFLIQTYNEGFKEDVFDIASSWTIDYGGDDSTGGDHIYFLCFDDKVRLSTDQKYTPPSKTRIDLPAGVASSEFIKREEAVQTLYDMAGRPAPGISVSRFKDVTPGAWYEDALLWGEENAICAGSPDISSDTFGTGKWVTRQDLALMMMRYAEYAGYNRAIDFGRADDFIDYYDIDYYAWEAITWAATWNIMIGKGEPGAPKEERTIQPHTAATRTDYREMLERMLEVNGGSGSPEIAVEPAGGHSHSYSPKVTVQPTCTEPGERTYTCPCGDTFIEVIPAADHKFTDKTISPTYDAQGYTLHTCSVCGFSYKNSFKPKKTRKSLSGAVISISGKKYAYTGKALKPKFTVKLSGSTLKSGTDYSASFKNNTKCGKATVTVTGKGGYTGSRSASFIIKPAKAKISKVTSPKAKQIKVVWKKSAGGVSGYEITAALNKSFTKSKKTATVSGGSVKAKTITGLKAKTTYYVRLRAYKTVGKTKYFGAWSAVKSVKTK